MNFDILKNKTFPVGKIWFYKVKIADEFYINDEEINTAFTSCFIKNEMLSINEKGNMFVYIEFSNIHFDSLADKIVSFLNKIINLNQQYVLELNSFGQIIDVYANDELFNLDLVKNVYQDEFYSTLKDEEKTLVNEKLNKYGFSKDIKKSLIILLCYPGYFRNGLTDEFAVSTHNFIIGSNFLENTEWLVNFSMNIYEPTCNSNQINLICTGNVFKGTKQEEDVLYQKINNHFKVDELEVYNDYTFIVMSDYKICTNNYFIKEATINICEMLNDEEIEFNKKIEITLVDESYTTFKFAEKKELLKNKFIKPKRVFFNN